jgi:hypothetical protein
MASIMLPSAGDIRSVVEEEVAAAGGTVSDAFTDGRRLFLRSIFPSARKVRAWDNVRGGVAVMAHDEEVRVMPYTFREVCRNGAIMAHVIETHRISRVEFHAPADAIAEVLAEVREEVARCAAAEVFTVVADRLESAAMIPADVAIDLIPLLAHLPQGRSEELAVEIFSRFSDEGDDSLYGLMNAVTRVARDEPDPQMRWDLEELGGGVPALVRPVRKPAGAAAHFVHSG